MWRDDDPPPLPNADSQQGLVHPRNHIPHPDVGVVCAIPLVAGGSNRRAQFNINFFFKLELYTDVMG